MLSSAPDSNDDLIAQFLREHAVAPDRAAHLKEWQAKHPRLAEELPALASMEDRLEQSRPADEPMPKQLGEFQIVRRLGASMGEVFEAWQPSLNRKVAIKTIRRGRISPQARDRFLREQKVLAGLHQTHIVPIHAAGEEAGLQYFVMPYIDGAALHHVVHTAREGSYLKTGKTPPLKELAQKVADSQVGHAAPASVPQETKSFESSETAPAKPTARPLPPLDLDYFRSVAQVMADAADALQFAHDAGILHRDLKPSNFMVDRQGHCWIIDFGLAEIVKKAEKADSSVAETAPAHELAHTVSGIMGTPPYMAPEQWASHADFRSDVYGLGVTLFELLTLRRAYQETDPRKLRQQIETSVSPAPREFQRSVPADLDAICRKAMNKRPHQRYQSATALAQDLRSWLGGFPTFARPALAPRRALMWGQRNKGWSAAIVLSILLSLAMAAGVIAVQWRENEAQRREIVIREAQGHRLGLRQKGWSEEAWKLLAKAGQVRVDDTLRKEAAASLIGLDVVQKKWFDGHGAVALAFNSTGTKLLFGAHLPGKSYKEEEMPRRPVRVWDQPTDQTRETTIFGLGPVTYDKKDRPLALTVKDENPLMLVLWDVDKVQPLKQFTLPLKAKVKLEDVNLALSANGTRVAATVDLPTPEIDKQESTIIAWDTVSGKVLVEKTMRKTEALALSPDGKELATGDVGGLISVWSLEGNTPPTSLKSGRLGISALAFGPNPKRGLEQQPWVLASGNVGGAIVVWDLSDKSQRMQFRGSAFDVGALTFSPDGATLASSGRQAPRLWDVATGKLILELDFLDFVTALAFTPDGKHFAMANPGNPVSHLATRVYELQPGRGLNSFRGLSAQTTQVEFSPDSSRLAVLAHDWEIGVWDCKTARLLHVFQAPPGYLPDNAAIAFSEDNKQLAFTAGTQARVWDLETGKEHAFTIFRGMVDALAFHAGLGKFLSFRIETRDGKEWPHRAKTSPVCRIRELTARGVSEIGVIDDFKMGITETSMSRNAAAVAVAGPNLPRGTRKFRIYTLPDGKELCKESFGPDDRVAGSLNFDPQGRFFSSTFQVGEKGDRRPKLLDIGTGKMKDWAILAHGIGPGGDWAATTETHPNRNFGGAVVGIQLHRRGEKTPVLAIPSRGTGHPARFNAAGTHFAWGTIDGTVIVCDIAATQAKLAWIGLGW